MPGLGAPVAPVRTILRGSLRSSPGPGGAPGQFVLQCRKLVLEYDEKNPSSAGMRDYLRNNAVKLAGRFPSVEVVVRQRPAKHPVARGFYMNGRTKEIALQNITAAQVAPKIQLLLDASGKKIVPLKRKPVESISEAARGIWSGLHAPKREI